MSAGSLEKRDSMDSMVLVGGLPRPAPSAAQPASLSAPQASVPAGNGESPAIDLSPFDSIAASLHREGFALWLRFDGEEFDAELLCGVDVLPSPWRRPRGRAATSGEAIRAAIQDKEKIVAEWRKQQGKGKGK